MPAKNPYTDAILNIADEYKALLKDAPKKKVPKIVSKRTQNNALDAFIARKEALGITAKPRRWQRG